MVAYTQKGPFVEDAAPALSPAFFNGLEAALLAMNNVQNTADLNKPVAATSVAAVINSTEVLVALHVNFYDQEEITDLLSGVAPQHHSHIAADISDLETANIAMGLKKIGTYNALLGESPGAISPNTLWLDIALVTPDPAVTFVMNKQDSTNASTWTFTPEVLLNTIPDVDYFIAFCYSGLAGGTAGSPANDVDSMTGGGMTWTAQGSPISQPNGVFTGTVFKTTAGTPNGTNVVCNATGGSEGVICLIVGVTELTAGATFKTATTSFTAPVLTLSGTDPDQMIVASIMTNSGSQTFDTDPGTPLHGVGSADIVMSNPSGKARMSLVDPAANSIAWTKSGAAQYITMGMVVGDA